MRMHFDSDRAWKFLQSNGYVFTLRKWHRNSNIDYDVEIVRKGEGVGKGRKVEIDLIEYLPELGPFVHASGFSGSRDIDEWWAEAERLSGKQKIWCLYYVHLVKR